VVGRARYSVGDVDKEEAEREQSGDPDVDLLRRNTVEDRQEQRRGEDARENHVHDVELVPSAKSNFESDVREQFVWTTLEVEFTSLNARPSDLPLTVRLIPASHTTI